MKKILATLLAFTLITSSTTPILANTGISVYVDGEKVIYDSQPITKNGSTLVPLRQTFEALGASVEWNSTTQTITANDDDTTIKLTIGSNTAYKNGDSFNISVPPTVVSGRTYVPLRFVAESFGADVRWDSGTQTVIIESGDTLTPPTDTLKPPTTSTTSPLGYSFGNSTLIYKGKTYDIITVDGGNLSGNRESNVAVDIGYGNRAYWGLTNDYGQLVYVLADEIILQDPNTETLNSNGRYYPDEAKVPGTEDPNLDEGHVIADSLGGVANAYNITPQNSDLNRFGDQAYMETEIRNAGGCSSFVATITYPNTTTQTPSHYHYEYTLVGNKIIDDFDNISPSDVEVPSTSNNGNNSNNTTNNSDNSVNSNLTTSEEEKLVSQIDTNGNGIVSIDEAKAAGYSMPIHSTHWLYKYMKDGNNNGMVGENS